MKSFLLLLPLLGLALAVEDKCQCPQVKCPGDDPVKLCNCLNSRETLCKQRCPEYVPTYRPCPTSPASTPTPKPTSCVCEKTYCPMVWPESCHCENNAKKSCYDKCGGPPPTYQVCDASANLVAKEVEPPKPTCTCETIYCPMIWPESCHCENNAKKTCYDKCGGEAPTYKTCEGIPTLVTKTVNPPKTTTKSPVPTGSHAICGGGRGVNRQCSEGEVCIKDPFRPGCGPACDDFGICVQDKLCGGFAGFSCPTGMICVDDPRDQCDPKNGGADCGGLCVYKSG
ncbi:hypothetical protein K469DRAFT_745947 [Zopfia rhizophila CBS 207.26]|uniref:Carbohydrate-binding module family 18 protein n=1 Tax=Zopfia rhizophila CBS 207.26 TaxID=1314779 RepID=A0A6A6EPA8_9PEZI|nr:hypothetical protein K469DRAFT_745947 [Zopfia rhizophila CBS 207.26]